MTLKLSKILYKAFLFIISLSIAWWLIKSGFIDNFIDGIVGLKFVAEFVAGAFYTSFLTSPISVAMLLVLAKDQDPITLALLAGLGSASVDLLIVKFFRKNLNRDFNTISKQFKLDLVSKILKLLKLDFLIPLTGALIVASPLPDELGLFLLGASKLKDYQILILTYVLNTAGILLIVTPINLLT